MIDSFIFDPFFFCFRSNPGDLLKSNCKRCWYPLLSMNHVIGVYDPSPMMMMTADQLLSVCRMQSYGILKAPFSVLIICLTRDYTHRQRAYCLLKIATLIYTSSSIRSSLKHFYMLGQWVINL